MKWHMVTSWYEKACRIPFVHDICWSAMDAPHKRASGVREIYRSTLDSPHKGPEIQSVNVFLLLLLMWVWTNCWIAEKLPLIWDVMVILWYQCKGTRNCWKQCILFQHQVTPVGGSVTLIEMRTWVPVQYKDVVLSVYEIPLWRCKIVLSPQWYFLNW